MIHAIVGASFVVAVIVAIWAGSKKILSVVNLYISDTKKRLSESEKLKQDSEDLLNEMQHKLTAAKLEAKKITADATAYGNKIAKEEVKNFNKNLDIKLTQAKHIIHKKRQGAVKSIQDKVVHAATSLAAPLLATGDSATQDVDVKMRNPKKLN